MTTTVVNERLARITALGTSIWLDQIQRSLTRTGEIARIDELQRPLFDGVDSRRRFPIEPAVVVMIDGREQLGVHLGPYDQRRLPIPGQLACQPGVVHLRDENPRWTSGCVSHFATNHGEPNTNQERNKESWDTKS